jgi:hypothetical protein
MILPGSFSFSLFSIGCFSPFYTLSQTNPRSEQQRFSRENGFPTQSYSVPQRADWE